MLSSSAKSIRAGIVVCAALLVVSAAHAGRTCEERVSNPGSVATSFDAAFQLKKWLDQERPDVALIVRQGQDLSKYKVTYSHAAFVLKDAAGWTVLHDLNLCESDKANLFEQGLAEFFDDPVTTESAVIIPTPEVQHMLRQVLSESERFKMHQAHYSAVAYPFALGYQNSNGWILETFVRALSKGALDTRTTAQASLQQLGYTPDVLEIDALTRLGGRLFKASVAFDDHPGNLRWAGKITVNTGDSVIRFTSKWATPQSQCNHGNFSSSVCVLPQVQ